MDARGRLDVQRAFSVDGREFNEGREYDRSLPLSSLKINVPPESRVTWFSKDMVESGSLKFNAHVQDKVVQVCQAYGNSFDACTLMKVNNDTDGDKMFPVVGDFYPVLHKMINHKMEWGTSFKFLGRASFELGVLEWTDSILREFGEVLRKADIYGAVAVSRYPYAYRPDVWRAFCELWGPLTNTFHHAGGEMGISLYDLKVIGGLPILGDHPYEEFIPSNEDLQNNKYSTTIGELLRIHTQLCAYHGHLDIYWNQWIAHFYRGNLECLAYEEGKHKPDPRSGGLKTPMLPLHISDKGRLAAFLAFWLSRFVLPSKSRRVRPESFYMASLMADGICVSLAPAVLGHIYHGLGEMAVHPSGPGLSNACLPIHYVIGWLGEHVPGLYQPQSDKSFVDGFPYLIRYAGIAPLDLNISKVRLMFRSDRNVIYRPTTFAEHEGRVLVDDAKLSDQAFEYLLCMRSAVLPVRIGSNLWLEPYYPNRFARQFGFDQGVPSNRLSFSVDSRRRCGVKALARAQTLLFRRDTTACFYIPRSTCMGGCTRWYCRWWMAACQPYMGFSISQIYEVVNLNRGRKDRIYVVKPPASQQSKAPQPKEDVRLGRESCKVSAASQSRKRRSSCDASKNGYKQARYEENNDTTEHVGTPISAAACIHASGTQEGAFVDNEVMFEQVEFLVDEYGSNFDSFGKENNGQNVRADPIASESFTQSAIRILPQVRRLPHMPNLGDFVYELLGDDIDEHRREYISNEVQGIVNKLSSFETPGDLYLRRAEIFVALTLLSGMVSTLKLSQGLFKRFEGHVRLILDLSEMYSKYAAIVEEKAQLDIDFINALVEQHGECCATIGTLELEFNDIVDKLANINATEVDVVMAENIAQAALQRAQDMRRHFENDRTFLAERRDIVESSLVQKRQLEAELRQARHDAGEHRLPHIKEAQEACAFLQTKIHGLVNTLAGPKN